MTSISVFHNFDYRQYLKDALSTGKGQGWGKQSELAKAMRCNSAYLSRVLSGLADLSLEQGYLANNYFGHNDIESEFFLNLILYARAGTTELKNHFKNKMDMARQENLNLSKRLKGTKTISEKQQAKYYSTWYYPAIHIATSVESLQSLESLSRFFMLQKKTVKDVLVFLQEINAVVRKGERFIIQSTHIHLGKSSDLIRQHHTNFRIKAIESIHTEAPSDLHYSSVVSIASDDIEKVKSIVVNAIEEMRAVIKSSKEETVLAYNFDLFKLG